MTRMKAACLAIPALACMLAAFPVRGESLSPSLFFLPEEVVAILESRRAGGNAKAPVETEETSGDGQKAAAVAFPRYIHLSAILHQADGTFEVWINGRAYRNLAGNDFWRIVAVDDDRVRLRLQRGDNAGELIEIAANQTFDLGGGRAIEGRPASLFERLSMPPPRIR